MDNGESPFTLQMPTLARDNGCVVYVYVLMLMAPTDHCDEHIYVPVGGRWSAPVGRDRSCSVTTVHSIISSSRLILSLPCQYCANTMSQVQDGYIGYTAEVSRSVSAPKILRAADPYHEGLYCTRFVWLSSWISLSFIYTLHH